MPEEAKSNARDPGLLLELKKWREEFIVAVQHYFDQPPIPDRRLDREIQPFITAGEFDKRLKRLRRKYRRTGIHEVHCAVICNTYEEIKKKAEDVGFYGLARLAYREAHRFLCMSYLRSKRRRLLLRWPAYFLWGEMSGYGQSSLRWLISVLVLIVLFAIYYTPSPPIIDPYLQPMNFARPALAFRQNTLQQNAPGLLECLEFSATNFVGFTSDRVQGLNVIARVSGLFEGGLGLVMFVVLGHLLSMRITGRIESVF